MRQRDYALGTAVGILSSLIGFVLLGGSGAAGGQNRMLMLGLSLVFLVFWIWAGLCAEARQLKS
jgi:uncharacterized membrane protein YdjX (TVP38/TMEM64 family)